MLVSKYTMIVTSNKEMKDKPKINMITKSSSRKQIIISTSTNNSKAIILQANIYKEVIISTNKAVASLDLNIIERYVKELNNIDSNNVISH